MASFHHTGLPLSDHPTPKTTRKKRAKSMVGNSMGNLPEATRRSGGDQGARRRAWTRQTPARRPGFVGVAVPASAGSDQRALRASIRAGRTLCTSPTMPRSATPKIGASWSLLMATMFFEPFMPTMCCVAPEMPQAR